MLFVTRGRRSNDRSLVRLSNFQKNGHFFSGSPMQDLPLFSLVRKNTSLRKQVSDKNRYHHHRLRGHNRDHNIQAADPYLWYQNLDRIYIVSNLTPRHASLDPLPLICIRNCIFNARGSLFLKPIDLNGKFKSNVFSKSLRAPFFDMGE